MTETAANTVTEYVGDIAALDDSELYRLESEISEHYYDARKRVNVRKNVSFFLPSKLKEIWLDWPRLLEAELLSDLIIVDNELNRRRREKQREIDTAPMVARPWSMGFSPILYYTRTRDRRVLARIQANARPRH